MSEWKEACPRCRENGGDASGDNLHCYGEGSGAFCFSCGYTILSDEEKEKRGLLDFIWEEEVVTKEVLTKEEIEKIKGYTGEWGKNLRNIPDWAYKAYFVRHQYDTVTQEPTAQYYPVFKDHQLTGFKIRELPKTFSSVGSVSKESDLFGQYKFRNSNAKKCVILAGEIDAISAYAMLNKPDSDYDPIPCVSAVVGETSSAGQLKNHYEWLNRFEQIIVCYDNDKAGKEAVKKLVSVLPKGKMFVMNIELKDSNEMLSAGKQKSFVDAFWKARPYTPDGIVGSGALSDKMREELLTPKVPLPPFMHKLQKMMAGGIPLGRIVNLGSASGTGKSTIIDEMLYYWVFNSPHKIGVVSLESDSGQYGLKVLSRHCGQKIELFETPEEAIEFMSQPWVVEKEQELLFNADGSHRWHIVEDRDGGLDSMKTQIMKLVIECECKIVVLDPLQDILDGLSNEEQAVFLKWMKGVIKSHKVTFINVNHVRKNGTGQKANSVGADLHEEDMAGSSAIFKSGACNLLFSRNKEAEDPLERNTTHMKASKIRWTGNTGAAGSYYYDNPSHTLYDLEDYLDSKGIGVSF